MNEDGRPDPEEPWEPGISDEVAEVDRPITLPNSTLSDRLPALIRAGQAAKAAQRWACFADPARAIVLLENGPRTQASGKIPAVWGIALPPLPP
jgi:hypothetical protein